MSEKLRRKTALVLVERLIADLVRSGLSQQKILMSIGKTRLEDLTWLDSEELLDCHRVLRQLRSPTQPRLMDPV